MIASDPMHRLLRIAATCARLDMIAGMALVVALPACLTLRLS
jgi:hypothetical protein